MIPMWVFTGFGALLLAACAAFFSITGLAALYAAAYIPVVIMAVAVEYGKVTATFWLHQNYKKTSIIWLFLISLAVVGAMAVTSGGVYGFLTKGHIEQESPIADTNLRIERIDGKIQARKNTIKRAQQRIDQLDGFIQKLIDFDKISGPTGANAIRESQATERKDMQVAIDTAYFDIDALMEQQLPMRQRNAAIEAKLGPVKYLAALFNIDTKKSVQLFTLLIVLLLDPFAIMMVVATSINYKEWDAQRKKANEYNTEHPHVEKIIEIEKEVIREVPVLDERRVKAFEEQVRVASDEFPERATVKIAELLSENTHLKRDLDEALNKEPEIKVVSEVVKEEIPLTMETLTEFLNNKDVQEELVKNPTLIQEVENIIEETKNKEEPKKSVAWVTKDGKPMEFSHSD